MNPDQRLTDLLHTASRAIGGDVHADPAKLIAAGRRRRRARGVAAAMALALVAALAVPALVRREQPAVDVAAGGPTGGSPLGPAEGAGLTDPLPGDAPTTTFATTTVAPEPTLPPTSAPPPIEAARPTTTSAPSRAGAQATTTVPATTRAPTAPPTTVGPPGEPELLSASGTVGRITLRFSRPVVPGDGPRFDRPTTAPSADTYMAAMQLVSHMTDSTCSSPNGNAHEYLAGVGTDTITVEATSLVVGTTYISISPGFVKNPVDGAPLKAVRCLGIAVG